jgi:hypothetical protein
MIVSPHANVPGLRAMSHRKIPVGRWFDNWLEVLGTCEQLGPGRCPRPPTLMTAWSGVSRKM